MSSLERLQRELMAVLEREAPPAHARLAIYHRGVRGARRAAAAGAYPVVRRLVGEAFFDAAIDAYARAEPPASGDLNRFGGAFAAFLASYPHAASLPYLPDVARLEWALHESLHAGEAEACDFASLAAVPEAARQALRLRLHPSVRLLESAHPVVAIWEANQPQRDGTPQKTTGPDHVLVHRGQGEPRPLRVPRAAWCLLQALARGLALGEACEAMGEDAPLLPALVAELAASGAICGFDTAA